MDLYKDFQALAKRYHLNVGQAVYKLAILRRFREPCLMRSYPPGQFPRSLNYRAFVESFPCCICLEAEQVKFYRVHEGSIGGDVGSDYAGVPLCAKCAQDPLARTMVVTLHCAIQNKLFEAYIRSSEGT